MVWHKSLAMSLLALSLAGCGGSTLTAYDLSALGPQQSARAPRGLLAISPPLAAQALDSERVLVRADGNALAYLPGVQWAERLPTLVQSRLVQSFENSHVLRSVVSSNERATSDAHLETEIRSFEYSAATGEVVVALSVKLINDRNGKIVKAQVFSARAAQGSSDGKAVVAGLDAALALVMRQIIGWVGSGI